MGKIKAMVAENEDQEFREHEGKAIIGKEEKLTVEVEERKDAVKQAIEGLRKLVVDKVTSGALCDQILDNLDNREIEETVQCDDRCREIRNQIKEVTGRMEVQGNRRE